MYLACIPPSSSSKCPLHTCDFAAESHRQLCLTQPSDSSAPPMPSRHDTYQVQFISHNKPDYLPSAEQIIERCREAHAVNLTAGVRGVALVAKDGAPYAWVKYGRSITMAEARTQQYVADVVKSKVAAPVRIPTALSSPTVEVTLLRSISKGQSAAMQTLISSPPLCSSSSPSRGRPTSPAPSAEALSATISSSIASHRYRTAPSICSRNTSTV
ncbi:hypothetical protein B0H21DRAFT_60158 [Amylocystis lapponica]|nr:hypothetical protein B0H21DRAFT_60158 [Amylocystis lapponica]